jgi:parallel beta-helix repeat protein
MRVQSLIVATVIAAAVVYGEAPSTDAAVIVVSSTIQSAVDAAKPGDTILVPPGTYTETVRVSKDDITIVGPRNAVLDASGFSNGIHIGAEIFGTGSNNAPVCPSVAVRNFTLIGLTIQNAKQNGVFLSGVDKYILIGGKYIDNGDYGPYPSCSNNGQIHFNDVSGGSDTCIYVGNDVDVSVTNNEAAGCTVGIQIVNSSDIMIRKNSVNDNTAGILAIVDPFNPLTKTDNVIIEKNDVARNNSPNKSTDEDLQRIPSGTGILNVGGDKLSIRKNNVAGNNTFGIAITQNPIAAEDPRIDPNPDGTEVRENVIVDNGSAPADALPGGDIFYDGAGTGNCFADNTFKTATPPNVETSFPCPSSVANH